MQDVSPTRLPPIDIHVKKLGREPAEKTWPKFKKVLIDYPRDRNLLYRQKLWDFQKLNRGAFRSHVTSLPEIPYRVNTNKPETASVGIQSDMRMVQNSNLKMFLPQISKTFGKLSDKLDAYLNSDRSCRETECSETYNDSDIEDPGFEFDTVTRRKNAGTMTEPFRKPTEKQEPRPVRRKKILKDKTVAPTERPSSRKIVKFEDNRKADLKLDKFDIKENEQKVENQGVETKENRESMDEVEVDFKFDPTEKLGVKESEARVSPGSSRSSGSSLSLEAENIGPSSQSNMDPLSVLDFLSGTKVGDARVMLRDGRKWKESEKDFDETPQRTKVKEHGDVEAERKWYEKIVGDKDLIDYGNYENFARTRPTNDSYSDSNEKYIDLGKNTPRRSNNFTPRINSEFSPTKSLSRTGINNSNSVASSRKSGETPTKANSRRTMIGIGKTY